MRAAAGLQAAVHRLATETSGWKLYRDALGFSIQYPTSWKVQTYETGAKILNEKRQQQTKPEGGDSGEAWVEIGYDAIPQWDAEALRHLCESGSGGATNVTFAGQRAAHCVSADHSTDVYRGLPLWGQVYWIESPLARALGMVTYAIDTDEATRELLDEMVSTTAFETKR